MAASTDAGAQALVVVGHGSHLNPDSAVPVLDHADAIRELDAFDEVRAAFWKEEPSLREVGRTLASPVAYVVPLFMSDGYFVDRVIPRELGITGEPERRDCRDPRIVYSAPVGTHPSLADVVVRRAESVTGQPDVGPGHGLAVVGHGTDRHAESDRSTHEHVAAIEALGRFDEVRALFMDEAPYVEDLTDAFDAPDVVLVPLFVADGYHTTEDIPEDVGLTADHRTGYDVPATVDGHRIWYAGAVGTESTMVRVILERARQAGATIDDGIFDAADARDAGP